MSSLTPVSSQTPSLKLHTNRDPSPVVTVEKKMLHLDLEEKQPEGEFKRNALHRAKISSQLETCLSRDRTIEDLFLHAFLATPSFSTHGGLPSLCLYKGHEHQSLHLPS